MKTNTMLIYLLLICVTFGNVYVAFPESNAQSQCAENSETHQEALRKFSGETHLWVGGTLDSKLARLKKKVAICYVIFEQRQNESCPVYRVRVNNGVVCNVRMLTKGSSDCEIAVKEFLMLCKLPAMLAYNNRVYLNAPEMTISPGEEGPFGTILLRGVYGIRADMNIAMPRETLSANVKIGNNQVGCVEGLTLCDGKENVIDAIIRQEKEKANKAWAQERAQKLKRLKKPPVVYGKGNKVIKRIDGTFEIPEEEPFVMETVYAHGTAWGSGTTLTPSGFVDVSGPIDVDIPVGKRKRTLNQVYDYKKLKQMMVKYQEEVDRIKNETPPPFDDTILRSKLARAEIKVSVAK